MKKAVKLLPLFLIICLMLIPLAACAGPTGPAGPAGAQGPEGLTGPEGDPGPAGPNAQIIASSSSGYAICSVNVHMGSTPIVVCGSNFVPGDLVHLTICEHDTVLVENIEVNECGAFKVDVTITEAMVGVVSLKAWVDNGDSFFDVYDELWACWPLWVSK